MGKVIPYTGITRLDIPPDRLLEDLIGTGLEGFVVMGHDAKGEEFFFSTYVDGGTVLWLIERCKLHLLQVEVPA